MFKTIFKAVASSVAKMAPHRCRALASKSHREAQIAKTLSPRADAILRNTNCISNRTRSQNQHNNALTQLMQNLVAITKNESVVVLKKEQVKVLVRRRMSASEMQTAEDYRIRAERGEYIPELENSNLTLTHIELGMHLESERWRWRGSTFVCAEGITEGQVRKWITEAMEGIDDQSRGLGINVIED